VPQNAQYYAAFGAVVFGMSDPKADEGVYRGPEPLREYLTTAARRASGATRPAARW
jgi:hypothetical protein